MWIVKNRSGGMIGVANVRLYSDGDGHLTNVTQDAEQGCGVARQDFTLEWVEDSSILGHVANLDREQTANL